MNPLQTFYTNENQREAVKAFMIESLGQLAIEMSFDGKDTKGIKEARQCIENSFDRLEELYAIIKRPIISNSK